jgi:hypothetical protein
MLIKRLTGRGLNADAEQVGIEWKWMTMDGVMVKAPFLGKRNGGKSHE